MSIRIGLEVLRDSGFAALKGKRVGLLTNPSAVDDRLTSAYDIFRSASEILLMGFFAPEHGFSGIIRDGIQVPTGIDTLTRLPVYSLYGEYYRPTADMLATVDAIVCDIQDVGSRFYTFIWTISHILEAAGEHGVEVVLLDRPNPLGDAVEGPLLDPVLSSLVGRSPIPIRHGMTLGELMQMFNARWNPTPAQLTVIACEDYTPLMSWEDTGRIFVAPSPAMAHISTARHYPGGCLAEGTTLSEGRGTTLPFEITGAPHLDGHALAAALNDLDLPGVRFRPHTFIPVTSIHTGQTCHGIQAHITDAAAYRPVETWAKVLAMVYQRFGFAWNGHFDRLAGTVDLRETIQAGAGLERLLADWRSQAEQFQAERVPYLIYPRN